MLLHFIRPLTQTAGRQFHATISPWSYFLKRSAEASHICVTACSDLLIPPMYRSRNVPATTVFPYLIHTVLSHHGICLSLFISLLLADFDWSYISLFYFWYDWSLDLLLKNIVYQSTALAPQDLTGNAADIHPTLPWPLPAVACNLAGTWTWSLLAHILARRRRRGTACGGPWRRECWSMPHIIDDERHLSIKTLQIAWKARDVKPFGLLQSADITSTDISWRTEGSFCLYWSMSSWHDR